MGTAAPSETPPSAGTGLDLRPVRRSRPVPLENGDRLTAAEFLRRYEEMPEIARLCGGGTPSAEAACWLPPSAFLVVVVVIVLVIEFLSISMFRNRLRLRQPLH